MLLSFHNKYMHKKDGSLYYKYYNSIFESMALSITPHNQYYRYATTKSISSPSKKIKMYGGKFQ